MTRKIPKTPPPRRPAIRRIQERIAAIDQVCSGLLYERTKVCGTPGCQCAKDPAARHGPYYVWSRREDGRLVQSNVTAQQARQFGRAIRNWRRIQRLLKQWERESAREIRRQSDTNPKGKGR